MPLLATLIGSMASGIAGFLATWIGYQVALKVAAYTTWIVVAGAFFTATLVCLSSLYGMFSGMGGGGGGGGAGNWGRYLWMGISMFIPPNSAAVMSCIASVWIGTSVWRIQRIGIENFSK